MKLIWILFLLASLLQTIPPETCFVTIHIEEANMCDGGTFEWIFCYNPLDPQNRDYHRNVWTCTSSIQPNQSVFLPLVRR